ncbi:ThuA domain-containing protein [Paenibacillus qinlingensis]|uniref:Type 1 glutamine amidotransferase n=1 Tax=Paenibacillus qinlingensis TaxID=1837343 RepID=A0ABU1NYE4_9BACL|nr:ThuA domain-containing protein [Paenibacillus qinlingensis]MDR6552525.1 type 1 glutamine amidotransferase [Paenibacillus qinlingensis]
MTSNILVLGHYTEPKHHPLHGVDIELKDILGDEGYIVCTEDYDVLLRERITAFDVVISYTDCWRTAITDKQAAGLLAFVTGGGGLLALHNGISLQHRFDLCQLIGGYFTGHPPFREITIRPSLGAAQHEIIEGIESFTIADEPYQFAFIPHSDKTVLLEYDQENQVVPAAWAHRFGQGRVVYLMPGHQAESFRHPVYREIIRNSCRWLVGAR